MKTERLTLWFTANYLQVNATKTQAMTLGKSQYPYNLFIGVKSIEIEPTLKILGVTLYRDLSFKPHVAIMLKKAYAKIAALTEGLSACFLRTLIMISVTDDTLPL